LKSSRLANLVMDVQKCYQHWDKVDRDTPIVVPQGSVKVVCVAEKPSVARAIAGALKQGRPHREDGPLATFSLQKRIPALGYSDVHVTSVVGHLFETSFAEGGRMAPERMFSAQLEKIVKKEKKEETEEGNVTKVSVIEHLQEVSEDADFLCLWLDCDREGENICFEVISVLEKFFPDRSRIFRAKFSALTEVAIQNAWDTMWREKTRPNAAISQSVDARQELDLRIGVSFTRLITEKCKRSAKASFPTLASRMEALSYGPCQSPTLKFVVDRHNSIKNFKSSKFWRPKIKLNVGPRAFSSVQLTHEFDWCETTTTSENIVARMRNLNGEATLERHHMLDKTIEPPAALDTVVLLQHCSSELGISPTAALNIAQNLYRRGTCSYPRTETTRYHETFDFESILLDLMDDEQWEDRAGQLYDQRDEIRARLSDRGLDYGDHPPITPTGCVTRGTFRDEDSWRVYQFIVDHFLDSLTAALDYTEHTHIVKAGDFEFQLVWHSFDGESRLETQTRNLNPMFANLDRVPQLLTREGAKLEIVDVTITEEWTKPPEYLKEADLISLMNENGIGTDATIPQHIQKNVDRMYCVVCDRAVDEHSTEPGPKIDDRARDDSTQRPTSRHLVPTPLGLAICEGMSRILPEMVDSKMRAGMEQEMKQIADRVKRKDAVVVESVQLYLGKFHTLVQRIGDLEQFFKTTSESYGGGAWKGGVGKGGKGGQSAGNGNKGAGKGGKGLGYW